MVAPVSLREYNNTKLLLHQLSKQAKGLKPLANDNLDQDNNDDLKKEKPKEVQWMAFIYEEFQHLLKEKFVGLVEEVRTSGLRPGRENGLVENMEKVEATCLDFFALVLEKLMNMIMETRKMELIEKENSFQEVIDQVHEQNEHERQALKLDYDKELENHRLAWTKKFQHLEIEMKEKVEQMEIEMKEKYQQKLTAYRRKHLLWKQEFEENLKTLVQFHQQQNEYQGEQEKNRIIQDLQSEYETTFEQQNHAMMNLNEKMKIKEKTIESYQRTLQNMEEEAKLEQVQKVEYQANALHFQQLYEQLVIQFEKKEKQNAIELAQIQTLKEQLHQNYEQQIHQLENHNKEEMISIFQRVKTTIDKKNQTIQNLQNQLDDVKQRVVSVENLLHHMDKQCTNNKF